MWIIDLQSQGQLIKKKISKSFCNSKESCPRKLISNTAPYFDDFDPQNNYYKVLFKPGYPVQARELTTLQSILQDQIEKFGNHVFKEGDSVTGGGVRYNNQILFLLTKNLLVLV